MPHSSRWRTIPSSLPHGRGYAARNDSEQVLKIDPDYADANMAIGIQQFAVASLPRLVRMVVGIAGVGGNKERGLELLQISAAKGVVTRVESRTTLSLFLRHDARYGEALAVQHGLAQEYPHDYLFRLEEANLAKDKGDGPGAIAIYKQVLADAQKARLLRRPEAADGMVRPGGHGARAERHSPTPPNITWRLPMQPNSSDWLRKRAQLNAGEMLDLLHDHAAAVAQYQKAAGRAEISRKLRQPGNTSRPLTSESSSSSRVVGVGRGKQEDHRSVPVDRNLIHGIGALVVDPHPHRRHLAGACARPRRPAAGSVHRRPTPARARGFHPLRWVGDVDAYNGQPLHALSRRRRDNCGQAGSGDC